jgi:sugar phosphate isomerase/epimerase
MIYLSTGGHRFKNAAETALDFYSHGIVGVELSGGTFSATYQADLLGLPKELTLQVHNYFPPPANPFVLNLASNDEAIAEQSLRHVRTAMRLAVLLRNPVYSFHAGFRINPQVSDLGKKLSRYNLIDRDVALELFGERVAALAEEARREGVTLLIENNVLNMTNLATYGEDPLLLAHSDEIAGFMERMPSNVGLLLDVAHLKVSANSLKFDLIHAHETLKKWIRGYHLSDNDGTADSNEHVHSDSWFWKVLMPDQDYYSLEVYQTPISGLVEQYNYVVMMLAKMLFKLKKAELKSVY